ncbi:Aste57867_9729 [Aphanomyces stellatus]|uniref:Aste57867_9729 protein n=1 Tax=Aphanomyces stellatus TaxID=120398 RepID=A0A485KP20_9STRA|nr:hypothetical protein As57867_009691 [Aphanomyces stellatus]VFT86608.1 Aste57867_9729 [Aphanomyces stellatus]
MGLLKRGMMAKRGSGEGMFQRKNWKKRYVELHEDELRYFDGEGGALRGRLDVSMCTKESIAMQPADCAATGPAAPTTWHMSIDTPERRFFMAFGTETEMHAWAFAFLEAFKMNEETGRKTYAGSDLRRLVKEQKRGKKYNLEHMKLND